MKIETEMAELSKQSELLKKIKSAVQNQTIREQEYRLIRLSRDIQVLLPPHKINEEYIQSIKKKYGIIK